MENIEILKAHVYRFGEYTDVHKLDAALNAAREDERSKMSLLDKAYAIDDMRIAFEGGRKSVEAVLRFERHGDQEPYAATKSVKSFETFVLEKYKLSIL